MQLGGRLPPEKRVSKAILALCEDEPFYGSVAMHVETRPTGEVPTAGILPAGVLLFNPGFVDGLTDAQVRGLVAHEVLHLVLDFGERRGDRDLQRWNTAQDAVINHMLVEDGFDLPPGGVVPEDGRIEAGPLVVDDIGAKTSESIYDELVEEGTSLADLSGPNRRAVEQGEAGADGPEETDTDRERSETGETEGDDGTDETDGTDAADGTDTEADADTEARGPDDRPRAGGETGVENGTSDPDGPVVGTDERTSRPGEAGTDRGGEAPRETGTADGAGNGDGDDRLPDALGEAHPGGFDVHLDEGARERVAAVADVDPEGGPDWDRVAVEATQESRRAATGRGTTPADIVERIRERASESVDWRALLREQVAGALPSGYTWRRPADKSRATGTYLPATESRRLEAVVALDTSGSMTGDALARALGELRSLEREYDELDLTLVQHDAAVHRVVRDWRPSMARDLEIEGRGGTSHRPVFAWLRDQRPHADLLVAVTDGRTDLPEEVPPGLDVVWVLVGETVREPDPGTAVRVASDDPSV